MKIIITPLLSGKKTRIEMNTMGFISTCPVLILLFTSHSFSDNTEMEEICYWEKFEAKCSRGEVIVMQHAHYGRMKMGRCVEENLAPGYEGCHSDVLNLAHWKCSGKNTCQLNIPDPDFEATEPCSELQNYLETKYGCIAVERGDTQACGNCDYVKVTSPRGYLASSITYDTGCGSADCPWLIEASPGQKIHIKLLDFGLRDFTSIIDPPATCRVYAVIKETTTRKSVTVCGGKHRHEGVMTTDGNSLEVRILGKSSSNSEDQTHFLVQYEVEGCADPETPKDGWVDRNGDTATVKCQNSDLTWSLSCNRTSGLWKGPTNKCVPNNTDQMSIDSMNVDIGISISLIIAIALVIGALILTVGLVCFKRRVLKNNSQARGNVIPPPPPPPVRTTEPVYDVYGGEQCDVRPYNYHSTLKPAKVTVYTDNVNNEYTHIWERPLPQPSLQGIRGNQSV